MGVFNVQNVASLLNFEVTPWTWSRSKLTILSLFQTGSKNCWIRFLDTFQEQLKFFPIHYTYHASPNKNNQNSKKISRCKVNSNSTLQDIDRIQIFESRNYREFNPTCQNIVHSKKKKKNKNHFLHVANKKSILKLIFCQIFSPVNRRPYNQKLLFSLFSTRIIKLF